MAKIKKLEVLKEKDLTFMGNILEGSSVVKPGKIDEIITKLNEVIERLT
uniref:Uncharacterized protein n=1 Tax=viral metagenome TaxID=1070528 RepID=A0A6M3ISA0_9ZZZZ